MVASTLSVTALQAWNGLGDEKSLHRVTMSSSSALTWTWERMLQTNVHAGTVTCCHCLRLCAFVKYAVECRRAGVDGEERGLAEQKACSCHGPT